MRGTTVASLLLTALVLAPAVLPLAPGLPAAPTASPAPDGPPVPAVVGEEAIGHGAGARGLIATSTTIQATATNSQRKLVRDSANVLHAVYEDASDVFYMNSTNNGTSWGSALRIGAGGSSANPMPAIASNGTALFVVWMWNGNVSFRRSPAAGCCGVWGPIANISVPGGGDSRSNPAIAASSAGVFVAFSKTTAGSTEIGMLRSISADAGTVWQPEVDMVTLAGLSLSPSIAADGTNVVLVWEDHNAGNADVLFRTSANAGAAWSHSAAAPGTIAISVSNAVGPSVALIGQKIRVAWNEALVPPWDVFYQESNDLGATWLPSSTLVFDNPKESRTPSVAVDAAGTAYIVWRDEAEHPTWDLALAWGSGTVFTAPVYVVWSSLTHAWPAMAERVGVTNRAEWLWSHGPQAPFNVSYDYWYTGPNARPTLEWTGESGYTVDGVEPNGGTTAHTYTFRVNYTDAENQLPEGGAPDLWLDMNKDGDYDDSGERFPMAPVSPGDATTNDGKWFVTATTLPNRAEPQPYSHRFTARDARHAIALGNATKKTFLPIVSILDTAPILGWTGELGFAKDGVHPDSGLSSQNFSFHVRYIDNENNPPFSGFPELRIDINQDTFITLNEQLPMAPVDPSDDTYTDGRIYEVNLTLPNVGTYTYSFRTRDIYEILGSGNDAPAKPTSGPQITALNTAPLLEWAGDPGFVTDGVAPDTGTTSSTFTWRVRYTDGDNNAPLAGHPQVWVDVSGDGSYTVDERFTMAAENGSDTDYTDGKLYALTRIGLFDHVFDARYRFTAIDAKNTLATGEPLSEKVGPSITKVNRPPTLAWNVRYAGYADDGVEPDKGNERTLFRFRVVYTDLDGDPSAAGSPALGLDRNLDKTINATEWTPMSAVDPKDTDVTDGKEYQSTAVLPTGFGQSRYQFRADDGFAGSALFPPSVKGGPTTQSGYNNAPLLAVTGEKGYESDLLDPPNGTATDSYTFRVIYLDLDNDAPGNNFPELQVDSNGDGDINDTNEKLVMAPAIPGDSNYSLGVIYTYTTDPSIVAYGYQRVTSNYTYRIVAEDSVGASAGGANGRIYVGPRILAENRAPILGWVGDVGYESDGVEPEEGPDGASFTFRIDYRDADNDLPAAGYPKLLLDTTSELGAPSMVEEDPSDRTTSDGKQYVLARTLEAGVTHAYRFVANDPFGHRTTFPAVAQEGPVVHANVLPVLSDVEATRDGATYRFRVVYRDADGTPPADGSPTLHLDVDGDGSDTGPGETLAMVPEGGSTDYVAGVTFVWQAALPPGSHAYRITAKDARGGAATGTGLEGRLQVAAAPTGGVPTVVAALLGALIAVGLVAGFMMGRRGGATAAPGSTPHPAPQGGPPVGSPPPPPPPQSSPPMAPPSPPQGYPGAPPPPGAYPPQDASAPPPQPGPPPS